MDRLKLLDAGLRVFDSRLPAVAPPLCVVTRYRASTCRLCLDVCPTEAITTTPWLRVDSQRCTSCGACAARCKTGALSFVSRARRIRERLHEAREASSVRAVFLCGTASVPDEAGEALDDDESAVIVVPCLGALSVGDLVAPAAAGYSSLFLIDGGCLDCADRSAGLAAGEAVGTAKEMLARLLPGFAVRRVSAPAADRRPALQAAVEAVGMSRRDLFAYVANGVRRAAAEASVADKPKVASLHEQIPPPQTRTWLTHDLGTLSRRGEGTILSLPLALPFGRVIVSPACDGCGLCVRYCPHAALRPGGAETGAPVVADDERCTGCRLCVESCPRDALTIGLPAAQAW